MKSYQSELIQTHKSKTVCKIELSDIVQTRQSPEGRSITRRNIISKQIRNFINGYCNDQPMLSFLRNNFHRNIPGVSFVSYPPSVFSRSRAFLFFRRLDRPFLTCESHPFPVGTKQTLAKTAVLNSLSNANIHTATSVTVKWVLLT